MNTQDALLLLDLRSNYTEEALKKAYQVKLDTLSVEHQALSPQQRVAALDQVTEVHAAFESLTRYLAARQMAENSLTHHAVEVQKEKQAKAAADVYATDRRKLSAPKKKGGSGALVGVLLLAVLGGAGWYVYQNYDPKRSAEENMDAILASSKVKADELIQISKTKADELLGKAEAKDETKKPPGSSTGLTTPGNATSTTAAPAAPVAMVGYKVCGLSLNLPAEPLTSQETVAGLGTVTALEARQSNGQAGTVSILRVTVDQPVPLEQVSAAQVQRLRATPGVSGLTSTEIDGSVAGLPGKKMRVFYEQGGIRMEQACVAFTRGKEVWYVAFQSAAPINTGVSGPVFSSIQLAAAP